MKLWNISLFWDGVGKDVFRNEKLIDLYMKDINLWREYLYENIWIFIDNNKITIDSFDWNENKWEIMLFLDKKILSQLWKKDINDKRCNQIIKYLKISLRWYMFNKKINHEEHISIYDNDVSNNEESPLLEYDTDVFVSNVIYNSWLSEKDIKICLLIKMWLKKRMIKKFLGITDEKYNRIFNKFKKILITACKEE